MNNINIFNETKEKINVDILNLVNYALKKESINKVEFNIIFVDNNKIRDINKKYRNIDDYTDVISFALEDYDKSLFEGFRILGDIYISLNKVEEQSKVYNHSYERELSFLIIHGLLHLLGYDHMNEKDQKKMFNKQEEILNGYGIKR